MTSPRRRPAPVYVTANAGWLPQSCELGRTGTVTFTADSSGVSSLPQLPIAGPTFTVNQERSQRR